MRYYVTSVALAAVMSGAAATAAADPAGQGDKASPNKLNVHLGPRPFFLVDDMQEGPLKEQLQACSERPFRKSDFSIGHRGAALQFPEHTRESYEAAARMGAGILECDVTFTKDLELVCRHAQNDLHTTTNILVTPLASQCHQPFVPAVLGPGGEIVTPARAECRTSDITLAEFKTLRGKMDAFNPAARTPQEYLGGTSSFRTDLYTSPSTGELLTHRESIELFRSLGAKMTPELKAPVVAMPFNGFTQQQYAQKLIDEYRAAGVGPRLVFPQSFNIDDVLYWVNNEPAYGWQAVYLDDANTVGDLPTYSQLVDYKMAGINIWAPPTFALLSVNSANEIVASEHARNARAAGLDLITWTLERSGVLADGNNGFYYQTFDSAISREGDLMTVIDVLAREVGARGVFSDWPAALTYYANCMGLR